MHAIKTYIPAAVLIGSLFALPAFAQETKVVPTPTGPTQEVDTPPAPGTPEHAAQLKREHDRAVAAGDHANDPLNPASSNALNQQEAAKAQALGTAPVMTPPLSPNALPEAQPETPPVPNPNLPDPSGNTAGPLPADPDPTVVPPPVDGAPKPAGDSLKPDTATVQ